MWSAGMGRTLLCSSSDETEVLRFPRIEFKPRPSWIMIASFSSASHWFISRNLLAPLPKEHHYREGMPVIRSPISHSHPLSTLVRVYGGFAELWTWATTMHNVREPNRHDEYIWFSWTGQNWHTTSVRSCGRAVPARHRGVPVVVTLIMS